MRLNSVVVVVVVVVACSVYRTWDLVRARLSFVINLKTGTILATVGLVVWVIECVGPGLGGVDFEPEPGVIEPKIKYLAEKKYPDSAKKAGKEGKVILKATIDENGIPRDIVAVTNLGYGLEEAAITMLRKSTFRPATKAGKPISLEVEIPVDFKLKDN